MEHKPIVITIGSGQPTVTVIGGMHGNEHIGIRVFEQFINTYTVKHGTFRFVIANPAAVSRNIRFIESDLNRNFPGFQDGNVEQNLALHVLDSCKDSDILLDFHTCPTPTSAFCITRGTKQQLDLARICNIDKCIIYPLSLQGGASLIDYVPCGIGFELGSHQEKKAILKGCEIIKNVLSHYRMVECTAQEKPVDFHTYKITDTIIREGDASITKGIHNFTPIHKGSVYAIDNGKEKIADSDFIPVLFAIRKYNKLIGLQAKEVLYKYDSK